MHALSHGWQWQTALTVRRALIAATDPVCRYCPVPGDERAQGDACRFLVEAESLFNDAVAAVLFVTLLTMFDGRGGQRGPGRLPGRFMLSVERGGRHRLRARRLGACPCLLLGRTDDHLIETAVTTACGLRGISAGGALPLLRGCWRRLRRGWCWAMWGLWKRSPAKGHEAVQGRVGVSSSFLVNSIRLSAAGNAGGAGFDFRGATRADCKCAIVLSVAGAGAWQLLVCCLPFAKTRHRRSRLRQSRRAGLGRAARRVGDWPLRWGCPCHGAGARGIIQTATFAVVAFLRHRAGADGGAASAPHRRRRINRMQWCIV